MSEYYKIEGVKIAGCDIYIAEADKVDKVGIALRDMVIENLRAKEKSKE